MKEKQMRTLCGGWMCLILLIACTADAWQCNDEEVAFQHRPSSYYGSGEYLARCPGQSIQIRCYHYHRHWVCEQTDLFFWDRNLDSAARTACGCPLPDGVAPSSPAVSREPDARFHDVPAQQGQTTRTIPGK